MERSVLFGEPKITGPLSAGGITDKVLTWDPATGRVGTVDNLISGVTGDISINSSGVSSINAGVIVNADINSSAAIAWSKMAALSASRVMVTDGSGVATTSITTTVFNYIANLSSDAQAQINTKQATIVGAASTVVTADLSANKAVVSGAGGKIEAHPNTTLTEIGYVNGVTGPIQTQLNTKLTVSLSSPSSGQVIAFDGTNWVNAAAATGNLPTGGTANQYLKKVDGTDYNTTWGTLNLAALGVTASITEVDFLIGSGANIQGQLNTKLSSALATDNLWVGVAGVATATTDLPTGTTIGSAVIYRVGGTDVVPADGGTGISSYAVGDILYASGATTLSKLAGVATGNALISGGVTTAPSWGKIGLTTHISGVLPIANGGTNLSTLGTALQVLRVNAGATALEYATISGGITNGAASNELMKSDGTNAVSSGILSSTSGNLTLGLAATTGTEKTISTDGSSGNIDLRILPKGNGGLFVGSGGGGNETYIGVDNITIGGATEARLTGAPASFIIDGEAITIQTFDISGSPSGDVVIRSGNALSGADNSGNVYLDIGTIVGGSRGNIGLFTQAGSFGSGQKVIFTSNATSPPSSNPTSGFLNWSDGSSPKWRTGAGDIYQLQDAFYMGDKATDGTWRFMKSGDDLLIQQREAGSYVTKSTISGA